MVTHALLHCHVKTGPSHDWFGARAIEFGFRVQHHVQQYRTNYVHVWQPQLRPGGPVMAATSSPGLVKAGDYTVTTLLQYIYE